MPQDIMGQRICFVKNDALSPGECRSLIKSAEEKGFRPALLDAGQGEALIQTRRKLDQCTTMDKDFADSMFQMIFNLPPRTMRTTDGSVWKPACLSERMRVLGYGPGHFITSHRDDAYSRDDECSFLTAVVYLDNGRRISLEGPPTF